MSSAPPLLWSGENPEALEARILPGLALALDALLEAAALARPGEDAEIYAAELRTIGHSLEALTREVEALGNSVAEPQAAFAA
jgi:hypothetical protein